MNKQMAFVLALVSVVFLFAGCIAPGGGTPSNGTNTTPPGPLPPKPSFIIAEPVSGDSIPSMDDAADVSVTVSLSNLVLKPAGSPNADGEGHFRISIDAGDYASFYGRSYTLTAVPLGSHTVVVEFVNNDGTPYSPSIRRTVSFDVVKYVPPVYIPENYIVNINDYSYDPANLTVRVGDSVTFVNVGAYPRSATATGVFDTTVIPANGSATVVLRKEGTFNYFSLTYLAMKGTITVVSNSTVDTS